MGHPLMTEMLRTNASRIAMQDSMLSNVTTLTTTLDLLEMFIEILEQVPT